MREFICDICGVSKSEYEIFTLYDDLQPEGITDVCEECRQEIVDAKLVIEKALKPIKQNWIKKIIIKMAKRKHNK